MHIQFTLQHSVLSWIRYKFSVSISVLCRGFFEKLISLRNGGVWQMLTSSRGRSMLTVADKGMGDINSFPLIIFSILRLIRFVLNSKKTDTDKTDKK